MEHETNDTQTQEEGTLIYIVGAIIVVAVVVAAILLWPKPKSTQQTATPTPENNVITKTTLTKLVCENEWFNPVIGMPKYYLSAEGGDVSDGEEIECSFSIIKDKDTVVTEKVTVPVAQAQERGGTTFKCTTKALEKIPQATPVQFVTVVKNREGKTASCSGTVTFR